MTDMSNLSELSTLIDEAQKKASTAASKNSVYLIPQADGTWQAAISDTAPMPSAACLTPELGYPVTLYYARTDLNGSSCIEADTCKTAEELLPSLNWLGKCSLSPLQLWSYAHDKPISNELASILDAAATHRHALIQSEISAFLEDQLPHRSPPSISRSTPERD